MSLGRPRLHLRSVGSTSDRAKELAAEGAPHGTVVTATEQTAGHGRQGRAWVAPAGEALLMSVIVREPPTMLPLAAAAAVAEAIGVDARIKWPNDVLLDGGKVAGILVEARPQDDWAVLGVGVNVAVRAFPAELEGIAASLRRAPGDVEPLLWTVLEALERHLAADAAEVLDAWRSRDALRGRAITWSGGGGIASGIDGEGRLVVSLPGGGTTALQAGEVHLGTAAAMGGARV